MLSDATRFRRTACGLCLIAAPLLRLLGDLLGTRGPTDPEGYLDVIAERPVAEAAAIVLAFCGFALTVPAVVGIVHLMRHRAVPVLLVAGTIVRLVGAASLATVVLGYALFLVALGYVGLAVLRQPDREWERPPERR